MKHITGRDRFQYRFDNFMSRGPKAMILGLGILSVVLVVVISTLVMLLQVKPAGIESDLSFFEIAWLSLMRTLDAGTMGGDEGWGFRICMFLVTVGGVFIVSTFIGVLTSGIESRLDNLRKGRSFVVEKDHTVILGWSEQVFAIIKELIEANASRKNACIVILAEKDKVEMEDDIESKVEDTRTTRIVCRSGSPADMNDIALTNPDEARSIIILSAEASDPDSQVIKTTLALTNAPGRRPDKMHIVAEIRDPQQLDVAKMVGRDEATFVLTEDLIARVMVQTSRQSGLSVVYTELLDFGGDEIYFYNAPELAGKTFRESLFAFEDSSVIGLCFADGRIQLNPPMNTVLQSGDKIIVIAEDDDKIHVSKRRDIPIDNNAIRESAQQKQTPEHMLILGWNPQGTIILRELDKYVAPGSHVKIVHDDESLNDSLPSSLTEPLKNLRCETLVAHTTERAVLEALVREKIDHLITLSDRKLGIQEADAKTLVTLLHLREIAAEKNLHFSIVSEMLDNRNRELATVTRADDFIVSDKLIALLLSQLSENRDLNAVFTDLFDPEGSEIYLKPAGNYVEFKRDINFYTILESASRRGETAIGYRHQTYAHDAQQAYGVKVNPKKSENITLNPEDKVIVLAEN